MEDVIRFIGIGLSVTMFSVLLRQNRPEFGMILPMLGAALILFCVLPYLVEVFGMFEAMAEQVGMQNQYFKMILKVIGIAYLCQFGAELCKDAGESAVASKIELGGKVMILAVSMPVIVGFLDLVRSIIAFG